MTLEDVALRIFNFDATLAPPGKTVLSVLVPTRDDEHWVRLRRDDRSAYNEEKKRIAGELLREIDQRLGDVEPHVEVVDVATPATFVRYTNNWKGSFEGWLLTPEVGLRPLNRTLATLDGFYHAGQWVEPGGGLPASLMSGRNVAQVICRDDGKRFSVRPV